MYHNRLAESVPVNGSIMQHAVMIKDTSDSIVAKSKVSLVFVVLLSLCISMRAKVTNLFQACSSLCFLALSPSVCTCADTTGRPHPPNASMAAADMIDSKDGWSHTSLVPAQWVSGK